MNRSMADLIGFDNFLNESAPFVPEEHEVVWKMDRHYPDFAFGNNKTSPCVLPRFWDESGSLVKQGANTDEFSATFDKLSSSSSCYDSDFDQVGRIELNHVSYLTFNSTAIPKPLASFLIGRDSFRNLPLCKIDCGNGSQVFSISSNTCIVLPFLCSTSTGSVSINPHKLPSMLWQTSANRFANVLELMAKKIS
jgi:hypothetical protein